MYLLRQNNNTDYFYKEYYLDTQEELSGIDITDCCPGSVAYIINSTNVYVLNTKKQWILQGEDSGGGTMNLQEKSITISENGTTNIEPDVGYNGLSSVNITTNVSGGGADLDDYFGNEMTYLDGSYGAGIISTLIKKIPGNITLGEGITTLTGTFDNCINLVEAPTIDTTNITSMSDMFCDCHSLTTVPVYNTSQVIYMLTMFENCPNLSNESLNNILLMCANSAVTQNKTLENLGLTEEQAEICITLSNYQTFMDAGWTTGYES